MLMSVDGYVEDEHGDAEAKTTEVFGYTRGELPKTDEEIFALKSK